MATIKKSLATKPSKERSGLYEVRLRISISRACVFRIRTGIYIPKEAWNSKGEIKKLRSCTKANKPIFEADIELTKLCTEITERINKVSDASNFTKEWFDRIVYVFHYGEPVDVSKTLVDTFEEYINTVRKDRLQHDKSVFRMLKRYEVYRGGGWKWMFDDVTTTDLADFESFLINEHTFWKDGKCIKHQEIYLVAPETRAVVKRGPNGIYSIMNCFKTFYNYYERSGVTKNNPFKNYTVREAAYGDPVCLTQEELDILYEYDFSDRPMLATQRDIFIFQSCIGARVTDLMSMTAYNLVGDTIQYIAGKKLKSNPETLEIPLSPRALEILKRYENPQRKELLPFISQQNYNEYIKEAIKEAGINRVVPVINKTTRIAEHKPIYTVASSHMARRTFTSILYENVQDPNIIGSMTGHAPNSKAFARYRKIGDKVKRKAIAFLK